MHCLCCCQAVLQTTDCPPHLQANGEVGQAQRLPLQEAEALRHMMVCLTDEPLVLTIKLADRLHNMRTCHALKPDKRAAVAIETLEVWCSLAEQLGMFPLKVGPTAGRTDS